MEIIHRLLTLFHEDATRVRTLGRAAANALRVFDAFRNLPLAPDQARKLLGLPFKPFLDRAELPPTRFHDLRHTCVTMLLVAEKGRQRRP